nr:MAG TPA: hypothetical protein [Bacteriophage sp.]
MTVIIDVLSHGVVTQFYTIHKCPIYKGLRICGLMSTIRKS